MAEVLLLHHALGQTPGFLAFAGQLRAAGHVAHTPDLFEGRTFAGVDDGVAYARATGFQVIADRASAAAESLPADLVYAGFSLGGASAQQLAQTRPGALGAILMHSAMPPSEFGAWPQGVPVQIHFMEDDPWGDEDIVAARAMAAEVPAAELFLYAGSGHLFADSSSADFDPAPAALLTARVLAFLAAIDTRG
jgi:dienelactone hydrolase